MESRGVDDYDRVLDHSCSLGDSVPWCAVDKATDVYGVDGRDVPNRLGHLARIAGGRLLRMGHACWLVDAAVRIRSDATPTLSRGCIALGKAKADQEC
jgi:hypothetical protein